MSSVRERSGSWPRDSSALLSQRAITRPTSTQVRVIRRVRRARRWSLESEAAIGAAKLPGGRWRTLTAGLAAPAGQHHQVIPGHAEQAGDEEGQGEMPLGVVEPELPDHPDAI